MVNISGAWWTVVIFSCIQKRPNNDYSLLCFFKKKKKKQTTKINVWRTFKKKIAHNALQCKTALVLIKPSTCFCISTNSRIQPDGAYCHVLFRSIVSSQAAEARETYCSGVDWRPTERFLLPFFHLLRFSQLDCLVLVRRRSWSFRCIKPTGAISRADVTWASVIICQDAWRCCWLQRDPF